MTNRAIIKRALRMIGVLAAGREPSSGQATDALEVLQSMVNAIVAPLGGPWIEQEVTTDVTAEENDRIRVNSTEPITVTIPVSTQGVERVVDTCGCVTVVQRCTETRAPRDMAKVWVTDVYGSITSQGYIYRADRAEWILASALTLDGESAFGPQYDEGFAARVAEALAPEYDAPLPQRVSIMAAQSRLAMAQRFDVPRQPVQAEYF